MSSETAGEMHSGQSPTSPQENGDVYDNLCGICFTPIHPVDNPRGRLNSCDHLFCSYCISKWADSTNVCPHCKALFTRVFTWDAATNSEKCKKVRRRKFWNYGDPSNLLSSQEDTGSDSDSEFSDERLLRRSGEPTVKCEVCGSDHNAARMIFCDRRECPFVAHLECLHLTEAPMTFLCPACIALRETAVDDSAGSSVHPSDAPPSATKAAATNSSAVSRTQPPPNPAVVSRPALRSAKIPMPRPSAAVPVAVATHTPTPPIHSTPAAPTPVPEPKRRVTRQRVEVPDGPIDFAKAGLELAQQGGSVSATVEAAREDEYYFMVPDAHALSAFGELRRRQHELADIHEKQRQKRVTVAARHQIASASAHRPTNLSNPAWTGLSDVPGRKRGRPQHGQKSTQQTEHMQRHLLSMEADLTNPQTRNALEEQLAHEWARDMLPVLRRNRAIENNRLRLDSNMNIIADAPKTAEDCEREDRALWEQAMHGARQMARQKLDARATVIRQQREELVKAQAQREAAALAKLARIIALHRQRDMEMSKSKDD